MEQRLLEAISLDEDTWARLAQERAERVKALLVESGRVEAQRLILPATEGAPPSGTTARLDLE